VCGIIGGKGLGVPQFVDQNISSLTRRGPDNFAVKKLENGLVFGATRLAMIDPHPRSNQPMVENISGNIIVFNGEIYNFKHLRVKLERIGDTFLTNSDTEVLLKLLTKYGIESISMLEGMFAFAFYDLKKNSLLLARDFLGKKPLYYSINPNSFVFSSSLHLVKRMNKTSEISLNSLYTYLKLGYLVDPDTIYSDIKSVNPGEAISIDLNTMKANKSFSFFPSTVANNDFMDIQGSFDTELLNRVDGHSKFAISLSGGTDSSIIALRSARLGFKPETYSLGFANSDKIRYSEDAESAQLISKRLGLNFNLVEMPEPKYIPQLLSQFVAAMEEPNSNPTGLALMVLYSAMSTNGERLVLTGDGADEIFGGYDRYNKANKISIFPQSKASIIGVGKNFQGLVPKKILDLLFTIEPATSPEFWMYWHEVTNDLSLKRIYSFKGDLQLENHGTKTLNSLYGDGSRVSELMIRDLFIWLSMESNRKLDRVSMWNSIEARSPFQSERMIGKGFRIMNQNNYKVLDKILLKEAINGLETLKSLKRKRGFISPLGHWIRSNPEMIIESIDDLNTLNFFDKQGLNNLKKSVYKNNYKDFKLIWSLVIFSFWVRYSKSNI
jgi:asparagine synthase (glutamine-hydrolysing)